MEIALLVITGLALALAAFALFKLLGKKPEATENQSMLLLQNQMSELRKSLEFKLGESTKEVHGGLLKSHEIAQNIVREVTRVSESQKQISGVSEQLRALQDVLKNPKQRGVLGEFILQKVLENVLSPNDYELQYKFRDGTIVDAIVKAKDGIIPIDSKFSLENYNRMLEAQSEEERKRFETAFGNDLKIRIDETAKYIKPNEGTMPFAFMFIPSEAVYYDLLVKKIGAINSVNLLEYAWNKKVIVVSATTFYAYLQTVMQGLRALKVEESAQAIIKHVNNLMKHMGTYEDYFKKLGTHINTTVNTYNFANKEFAKIDKDILKITGENIGVEALPIAKAEIEEAN
jgi:DNA recombination protein RmuC